MPRQSLDGVEATPRTEAHPGPPNLEPLLLNRAASANSASEQLMPDLSQYSTVLHDACAQGVVGQVSVRTDAVTGQPLDIVLPRSEPAGGYHTPGTLLQIPGAVCINQKKEGLLKLRMLDATFALSMSSCKASPGMGHDTANHDALLHC